MRTSDIPPHLHDRYGIRPASPWRWVAVACALVLTVPIGIYAAGRYVATQQVPFALISWASRDDTHISVVWRFDATAERRWCAIRAQDFDHYDLGFAVVPIAAGATQQQYLLHTTAHPLAVDIVGCTADPFTLAGPQFRPGVLPPKQTAPGLTPGVYDPATLGQ